MRLTYPVFQKPENKKNTSYRLFEIFYHTILPCICLYIMITYEQPLFILPIITTLFIRFEK